MVFLAILAVARMVIWMTRKKGLYDGVKFSHHDLISFFRHQLRVKIRCDRKHLDRITFNRRWVHAASLVIQKGAMLESSFLPFPVTLIKFPASHPTLRFFYPISLVLSPIKEGLACFQYSQIPENSRSPY